MMMRILNRSRLTLLSSSSRSYIRRMTTSNPNLIEDEGDWSYILEWGTDSYNETVFHSASNKGNNVVSVLACHSSSPNKSKWYKTENWLSQRYADLYPRCENNARFKVLGCQWRRLQFNDNSVETIAKVMSAFKESDPGSIFLMQDPHCLALPYLKSMVFLGLASLSCNYNLLSSLYWKHTLKVLCIGLGGGSLPLFLASNIPGAMIDIVEIDPVVISASTEAMGFPTYSIMKQSGESSYPKPNLIDEVLWKGVHERLFLYESDAEQFITESTDIYDLVFVDAYDGDDIFPHKLWDPDPVFLKALRERVHPDHGTVVVNLHSETDPTSDNKLPMCKYVSQVCKAYKKVLLDNDESICGSAFTAQVPWFRNRSLVVTRGFRNSIRDFFINDLISKSVEVGEVLKLPFSCLEYIRRGFIFVD